MAQGPCLYSIRIKGRLGATSLTGFPEMASQYRGHDTVLTGVLPDLSALFGVLAEVEALGLELIDLGRLVRPPESSETRRPS